MLNKYSKVILKKLIKTNFEYSNIDDFSLLFPKISKHDVESTLVYLHEKEYIQCSFADNTIWSVAPSYKGEQYFQFQWVDFKDFLFKSIVIPIITSVATTILLTLLG